MASAQAVVAVGEEEVEDVWDDDAILRAFDNALSSHRLQSQAGEERKGDKQEAAGGKAARDGESSTGGGGADMGEFDAADSRFSKLLQRGSKAREQEGIPGEWETVVVTPPSVGRGHAQQQPVTADAVSPEEQAWQQQQERAAWQEYYQQQQQQQQPAGPPPHHAPREALSMIQDDALADLLLAWYYSGYYTGKYTERREAAARSGAHLPPAPPPPPPPPRGPLHP